MNMNMRSPHTCAAKGIAGVILPPFAESTYPCFGFWSLESMECANCLKYGTCLASLFDAGELTERLEGILEERALEKAAMPEEAQQ